MTDENTNNQRVTNALLQRDLEDIAKKLDVLPDIKDQLHIIDTRTQIVCTKVERNEEEINSLRKQGNIKDGILVAFTMAMGTISSILGTRQ